MTISSTQNTPKALAIRPGLVIRWSAVLKLVMGQSWYSISFAKVVRCLLCDDTARHSNGYGEVASTGGLEPGAGLEGVHADIVGIVFNFALLFVVSTGQRCYSIRAAYKAMEVTRTCSALTSEKIDG